MTDEGGSPNCGQFPPPEQVVVGWNKIKPISSIFSVVSSTLLASRFQLEFLP